MRTPASIAFDPLPPEAFGRSLVSRFEDQVARVPERLALVSAPSRLSYAELDRAANRLANELLAGRLPGPAIPWRIVLLDALPLTSSGKVDRNALPDPGRDRSALTVALVPPRSPVEVAVAALWREVLGLDEVGVHDDFLELGGESLQAMQIGARIAQRFAISLSTQFLLEFRTVAELSLAVTLALVEQEAGASDGSSVPAN